MRAVACLAGRFCGAIVMLSAAGVFFSLHPKTTEIEVVAEKDKAPGMDIVSPDSGANLTAGNLGEILDMQPGFFLRRYGAPGSFSHISIRGTNPVHTGIYIDSIPVSSGTGEMDNLSEIPLLFFEQIEIYRSFSPARLSSFHGGGAVNLVSPLLEDSKQWKLQSMANSLAGGSVSAGYSDSMSAHFAEVQGSLNRYEYHDDNGTPWFNESDDTMATRENEDYRSLSWFSLLRTPGNSRLLFGVIDRKQGLPGSVQQETSHVRYASRRYLLRGSGELWTTDSAVLSGGIFANLRYSRLCDPKYELESGFMETQQQTMSLGANILPLWFPLENLVLSFPLEYRFVRFSTESILHDRNEADTAFSGELTIRDTVLFAEAKSVFLHDQSLQSETIFSEPRSGSGAVKSFRTGLEYSPSFFSGQKSVSFFGAVNYSERYPAIMEFFGDGALLLPSDSLRHEILRTAETGLNISYLFVSLSSRVFLTDASHLILYTANSQQTMVARNIDAAVLRGFENEITARYSYSSITARYSFMDARDTGSVAAYAGKFLPYRPMHTVSLFAESGARHLRFLAAFEYEGATYRDRYNSWYYYSPARYDVTAGTRFLWDNSSVSFYVRNILDELREDMMGYPLPGRVYELQYKGVWK